MKIKSFMMASPAYSVLRVSRAVESGIFSALKEYRLNSLQAGILLGVLFEQRQVRPGELARSLGATPSNLSHALTQLERKKWLVRRQVAGDARGYGIELTERGRKIAASLVRYFDRMQERAESELGTSEAAGLVRSLEKVQRLYEKASLT